jgi:hypothetical protein
MVWQLLICIRVFSYYQLISVIIQRYPILSEYVTKKILIIIVFFDFLAYTNLTKFISNLC